MAPPATSHYQDYCIITGDPSPRTFCVAGHVIYKTKTTAVFEHYALIDHMKNLLYLTERIQQTKFQRNVPTTSGCMGLLWENP